MVNLHRLRYTYMPKFGMLVCNPGPASSLGPQLFHSMSMGLWCNFLHNSMREREREREKETERESDKHRETD